MGCIIQESFYISDEIMQGLNNGMFERFGGIIRYAKAPKKGEIYKHLKPVDIKVEEKANELAQTVLDLAKTHPVGAIVTVATVSTIVIGGVAFLIIKKHVPKDIKNFRKELLNYVESIHKGQLTLEQIKSLLHSVEKLRLRKDFSDISIKLSFSQMFTIIQYLNEYTKKLLRDNAVAIDEDEYQPKESDNVIISLEKYLTTQKKVFESAA